MRAYKYIQAAEGTGCILEAEGEYIRVMNIDSLPSSLKEKIKENKRIILDALYRDNQAKDSGFIIGVPGELYFCSLNKSRTIYIEQMGERWEVYRETFINGRFSSKNIRLICVDSSFKHVLLKAKGYVDYWQRVYK
ncbi:hypothetical protein SAMN05444673_0440 [Bacillus sp. OV166]|uniref:hypothetical protein n=1 Tax=Bacillus sp. OV166 TaxID=1882763 RepID=UPI000A2AB62A|nr:hypothetical protein [Bacillus sp. OV166]SMQ60920.1 hypothetical protein SAMN05444673_0440 [Bacillus sp. OV166]